MRRKYIALWIILGTIVLSYACESEMMGYKGGYNGEPGVYFVMQKKPASGYGDPEQYEYVDTTFVAFGMLSEKEAVIRIRIRVYGEVTNFDRYVNIKVDPESNAEPGVDYEPFDERQVIKAGERQVDIPCRIIWNEKLALNSDSLFCLTLILEENEFFTNPLKEWYAVGDIYGSPTKMVPTLIHTLAINDNLGKPEIWNEGYWGDFSPTKIKLMLDVLGLELSHFASKGMDTNRQAASGNIMAKYLREEKAAGRTVYDYDIHGNKFEMTMGPRAN